MFLPASSCLKIVAIVAFLACVFVCDGGAVSAAEGGVETVTSPNGAIALHFELVDGAPRYRVDFKGRPVMRPSALGFKLQSVALRSGGKTLVLSNHGQAPGFRIAEVVRSSKDETWTQLWGESKEIRNHYNEMAVELEPSADAGYALRIVFRVFDHAIAFRYEWPEQANLKQFDILDELTEFAFAGDHTALWAPALRPTHNEQLFVKSPLSELLRQSRLAHGDEALGDNPNLDPIKAVITPLTMQTADGLFLVVHEADLTDYAAMELQPREGNVLKAFLAPWSDGVLVKTAAPSVSPWRMVMVCDTLADVVELTSATSLNLNPPSRIADTSWIHPSKYIGIWWGMHLNKYTWNPSKPGEGSTDGLGATTENTRHYIDFAAKYGFKGVLVEGWNKGWAKDWVAHAAEFSFTEPNDQYDLPALAAYAKEKGVGLIAHHETGAIIDNYERQVEAAFALCQRLGIHHVKSGYVGMEPRVKRYAADGAFLGSEYLDGQYMVRHYRKIAELAAQYQIMLDAHECLKNTGETRTWPNFMTREGGRGQEWNAWSKDGGNPPVHDVNLVFTRFLCGPFDFTPGVLQVTYPEYRKHNRVKTTVCKQLAQYVCFYSPLQMAADLPDNYEKHRDLFQFIVDVPCDWEQTRMLNGALGEYVTIARQRRGGSDWYIGSMTDEKPRDFALALDFLPPGVQYLAEIYGDAADADWHTNPYAHEIKKQTVTRDSTLALHLAPGGGAAVRLTQIGGQEAATANEKSAAASAR